MLWGLMAYPARSEGNPCLRASGAGKTIAAKVIVEELLEDEIPVLVFDYTEQWQRALEKNTNEEMLDHYAEFAMRRNPKGFKGKVVETGCSALPAGSTASLSVILRFVLPFPLRSTSEFPQYTLLASAPALTLRQILEA